MATGGTVAFSPERHQELKALAALGWKDLKLAAHFDVSIPTVRKWLQLEVGFVPPKGGRKKKAPDASTVTGPISPAPEDSEAATGHESTAQRLSPCAGDVTGGGA